MRHHFIAIVSVSLFLASCVQEEAQVLVDSPEVDSSIEAAAKIAVPGESIVRFNAEMTAQIESALESGSLITKSAGFNNMLAELGVSSARRLFPHAGALEERARREGMHQWYVITYSDAIPYTKAASSIEALPGVELVEPVRPIVLLDYNDLTSDLWGLYNTTTPGADINVRSVWENYTTGNPDVIVAVVDQGVDLDHEDLAANCLSEGHYNAVNGSKVITPGSHGTHVAGTIAAVGNNGKGIVGIAGGDAAAGTSGVKIMSCQIFSDASTTIGNQNNDASAAAIYHAANTGAVICQNSWGYDVDFDQNGVISADELAVANELTVSSADKAAIDWFIEVAGTDGYGNQLPNSPMKGGVVIFAAGNDAIANGAPANYEKVIAVGSMASDGFRSSFSNYGNWVDICAPGTHIYSTVPDNQYDFSDGTSMACPHVSGVAALLVSYFGGPGFTNEMLKERLIEGSNRNIIPSSYRIGGLLDAYGSFTYGSTAVPEAVTDFSVDSRANTLDLEWTMPKDSDGYPAYGFLILYGTDKQKIESADATNYTSVSYKTYNPVTAVGGKVAYSLEGLEFEKEYYLKVISYTYSLSYSAPSDVITVQTKENNAPVISVADEEEEYSLKPAETLDIMVLVSEPDGHTFTVSLANGSAADAMMKQPDGTYRLTITGNAAPTGTYTAVINAEDQYGMKASKEIVYSIRDNVKPEVVKDMDDMIMSKKGQEFSLDLGEYIVDEDGEQLSYEIVLSNAKVAHLVTRNNTLYGTALAYGTSDVEIIARDARGEEARLSFKVLVKDPSSPVSVYPNPVTDYVNVGTLDMASTSIRISSSTGKLMFEDTMEVSGLEPAKIDMSSFAPGVYSIAVSFGGNEYVQNVVKL